MEKQLSLHLLGSYNQSDLVSSFDSSAAEILAYHKRSNNLYVTNSYDVRIDIINIDDPEVPELVGFVQLTQSPTSVSVHKNILAVALVNAVSVQLSGNVAFYDIKNNHALLVSLEAGALPDAVFFSPNGRKVVVCNEGEPDDVWDAMNLGTDHNPEGTITVVNIDDTKVADLTQADVSQLDFNAFNRATLRAAGVKITGPGSEDASTTLSQYMEPEYAAISDDSHTAYVALQENNALAVINLVNLSVSDILPFGLIDRSLFKNALDASNTNPVVDIKPWHDLVGMYQPDSIAYFKDDFVDYITTANEGDAQDYGAYSEEARVKDLPLDPIAFPDAASLQLDNNLGRLKVTVELGKNVNQLYDKIYSYGGRSFSVFKVTFSQGGSANPLELVFDSGAQFEKITNVALPTGFNSSNDQNKKKNRSDDKGPEPEALIVFYHKNHRYVLVGLERVGGVMVYDITDLQDVYFVQYINNRNFNFELSEDAGGDPEPTEQELKLIKDLGPESVLWIDSNNLVAVANEVSGSTSIYNTQFKKVTRVCKKATLNGGDIDLVLSVDENHKNIQWVQQDGDNFNVLAGETSHELNLTGVQSNDESVYFALLTAYCDDITSCVSSQRVNIN